jgi:hypothetical protein
MHQSRLIPIHNTRANSPDAYQIFAAARGEMLSAWQAWVETSPYPNAISEEMEGTLGALWGIACTIGAWRPGPAS